MAASIPKSVLVVGATGWLGSLATDELLKKKEHFQVKVLVRKATLETKKAHADRWVQQGATLAEGDIDDEASLLAAMAGVDTVLSFLGGARLFGGDELKLIHAAQKAGIKRFVPSEYGLDSFAEQDPVFQAKINGKKAIEASGMDHTYIFTGMFYEFFFAPVGGFDAKNGKAVVAGDGSKKISVISIKDIARYVPEILLDPSSQNATVKIAGEVLSQNDAVKIFEGVFGKKIEVQHTPLEEYQKILSTSDDFLAKLNARIAELQLTTEAGHPNAGAKYTNIVPLSVAEFAKSQAASA